MASNTVAELIFIPLPGFGHITSTIQIAKVLLNRNQHLSITVLIIKPPPGSAITNFTKSLVNETTDRIRLVNLPQEIETLPKLDPKAPISFIHQFIKTNCNYVRNVVADMMNRPSSRVIGFVVDMFCVSMMDVANEFNVPTYVYFTSNAAFLGYKLYIQTLCDVNNRDIFELSNSDTEVSIPSFVKPVPTKVFPAVYRSQEGLDFVVYCVRKFKDVKGIIVNTFLELETHALKSLSDDISIPPVYPVGPILNQESVSREPQDDDVIIKWLDGQPPSSVVFLCFGSLGSFDEIQVKEIAYALERSGYRFVWSLRRPSLPGNAMEVSSDYEDPGAILPDGFLERTAGAGKVIGWAPQVRLLAHPAVGGFVSHCGWNSLLESLWFGVPTATWPMYAEQHMNAFHMVVEMGLAVEIKFDTEGDTVIVTAEEIDRGIRRLMEDNEIRAKVKEMSKISRETVTQGGSSYDSIGYLIQEITN